MSAEQSLHRNDPDSLNVPGGQTSHERSAYLPKGVRIFSQHINTHRERDRERDRHRERERGREKERERERERGMKADLAPSTAMLCMMDWSVPSDPLGSLKNTHSNTCSPPVRSYDRVVYCVKSVEKYVAMTRLTTQP